MYYIKRYCFGENVTIFICNLTREVRKVRTLDFFHVQLTLVLLSPSKDYLCFFEDIVDFRFSGACGRRVGHSKGQSHIKAENGHVCVQPYRVYHGKDID